ncbi:hypothetical protein VNO77_00738 [Canavalia gladiata]|uniref:Uncharacterized protein n=1 Tax=Canavalia gladiata TaxID=3824 RepID=A0AAN9MQ72_CANGL
MKLIEFELKKEKTQKSRGGGARGLDWTMSDNRGGGDGSGQGPPESPHPAVTFANHPLSRAAIKNKIIRDIFSGKSSPPPSGK